MIDRLAIIRNRRLAHWLYGLCVLVLTVTQPASAEKTFEIESDRDTVLTAETIARFDEPWAIAFLPDDAMLVTTQPGRLWLVDPDGDKIEVSGVPTVAYAGQGGLGDVIVDPNFTDNREILLSYVASEDGGRTRGAVVVRAVLDRRRNTPVLRDITEIWRQEPFVRGTGHYSHRLIIGPKNTNHAGYLFIASGERQKQTPAQAMNTNLGKIVRLHADGRIPKDNPFAKRGGIARQFWTIGHRNILGLAFDASGQLWAQEMGPRHGDELNRIERGGNYGWPIVSEGRHYSGESIPRHATHPEFRAPIVAWVPAISPAGLSIYNQDRFVGWQGDALLGGLSSRAMVRVDLDRDTPQEIERFEWGERVRAVQVGPDGALWVLEDGDGRLLRLTQQAA